MEKQSLTIPHHEYSLAADFYHQDSDQTLLALIGRTSSRTEYGYLVEGIAKRASSNALVFDYSGHGDSPLEFQETTSEQHLAEALTVFDWLQKHIMPKKIHLVGTSYGGFLGAHLTQHRTLQSLVLTAPAIYPPEDFSKPARLQRAHPEATHAYRSDKRKLTGHPLLALRRRSHLPALIVAHGNDQHIPIATLETYQEALQADTAVVPGMGHSVEEAQVTAEQASAYQRTIAAWILKTSSLL